VATDVPAKFATPMAAHVVDRPRLHGLLTAGMDCPVTVVAATAGWGKTLLAASWVATGAGGRAPVWVTLDAGDDDPRTFWHTLARALLPVAGAAELRAVITDRAEVNDLPGLLAAALGRAHRPVVLILDNLHEVTSAGVHAGLLRLVQRPLPDLSLLVTTRHDPPWPLPRLRLAGLLAEVGAKDLAFRDDEAAAVFVQLHVERTSSQLQQLVKRTDGWPAGLCLAALHLQDSADRDAAVNALSGDDQSAADHLLTEVLARQSPELITFLQTISTVDVVCADLADALTGRNDSATLLAKLAASHLFLEVLDRPGRWHRLHRLIADNFRSRPQPRRERQNLQRRAADWHAQHGRPLDAIATAVAGELWPLAADLAGTYAVPLVLDGHARELERALTSVPRTIVLAHPELAIALAGARVVQGDSTDVGDLLAAARSATGGLGDRRSARTRALVDFVAGGLARLHGDWAAAAAIHRRVPVDPAALGRLKIADAYVMPVTVHNSLGTAALWAGDLAAAADYLQAAVEISLPWPALPQLNANAYSTLLLCERGELDLAQAQARAVIEVASSAGGANTPQVVAAYLTMARIALDRDDLPAVDDWLGHVADVEAVAPEPHVELSAALILAGRREAADTRERALSGLRAATARIDGRLLPRALHERRRITEAALLTRCGDPAGARAVVDRLGPARTAGGMLASARVSLLLGDLPAALAVRARIPPSGHPRARVDTALLDTLLAAATGDEHTALDRLEDALAAAAPWTLRRTFLAEANDLSARLTQRIEKGTIAPTFALDLLERMSDDVASARQVGTALVDPLTDREKTVLRYLAGSLTTAEIAAELYLSINTVKTHQRIVYRKLGAASRRTAVLRARELHLP
jgi:LuxR family maltose regulon positive regulatory protein